MVSTLVTLSTADIQSSSGSAASGTLTVARHSSTRVSTFERSQRRLPPSRSAMISATTRTGAPALMPKTISGSVAGAACAARGAGTSTSRKSLRAVRITRYPGRTGYVQLRARNAPRPGREVRR